MYGTAAFLFLAGIAFMVGCGIAKEHGGNEALFPWIGVFGLIALSLPSLIIALHYFEDIVLYWVAHKDELYSKKKLYTIENFDLQAFQTTLSENYKMRGIFYRKKDTPLFKDSVTYYFLVTDYTMLDETVAEKSAELQKVITQNRDIAFVIILKTDSAGEGDLQMLREMGKNFYHTETTYSQKTSFVTIPVIYEKSKSRLSLFYPAKKYDSSIYSYGCKRLFALSEKNR